MLIVLDGVDEATDWTVDRVLRLPRSRGVGQGAGVGADLGRLRRDGVDATPGVAGTGSDPDAPAVGQGKRPRVLRQMGFPLDRAGARVDVIAELYRLSDQGNPLLVRLYIDDLWPRRRGSSQARAGRSASRTPGLPGYFKRWWQDQQQQWETQGLDPLRERGHTGLL